MSQRNKEQDWKDEIRQQVIDAAEEIKTSAADTILASDKVVCSCGIQILIDIDPREAPTVEYRVRSIPRRFFKTL